MNVFSREAFIEAVNDRRCQEFMHPWSSTCTGGLYKLFVSSIVGSSKFCVVMFILQVAAKGRNITKRQLLSIGEYAVRLVLCGVSISAIFNTAVCAQRKILGRHEYYTIFSLSGFLSGAAIFFLQRTMRYQFITAFCCAAVETLLEMSGGTSIFKKPLLFMLMNSIFMYYLRLWKTHRSDEATPELWFFSPNSTSSTNTTEQHLEKDRRPCSHVQSCIKSTIKETSKYFWCGVSLEVLRIIVTNFKTFVKNPKTIHTSLFHKSVLRLASFIGSYVFLHKITSCALCRACGKNPTFNPLIAGFVSGLAFYTRPNLSVSITVFINLMHVIWRYHNLNNHLMKNFPTSELLFMFTCGLLFFTRTLAPEYSSTFFNSLISFCTNGRSDDIYVAFLQLF